MTVSCPECRSVFRVDPAKVPATGVRARCSVCGGVIAIGGGTLPVSVTPMGAPAFPGGVSRATPAVAPSPAGAGATGGMPTVAGRVPTPVMAPAVAVGTTPPSAVAAPTPAAPSAAVASATPSAARAPINPFLRADPSQRARRLARALVSDLVAYHPQKREDGLRDGTLRQLFREDIKKSYEEYVEQVGRDLAESAPHFQDALNDILAGGRRLF
jgi:predicted Zn finger-like uncharacterized protein